ncbi:galactosylgalactosylxylosylprotein 3-beta-glucuronosyltransferase P-like isoform X1 [Rhagoletis pomonella]|uniref:galactosylgalactosylxylosylprotein 3-beta-glucuronosyltransferase P-like isoform X1 n=1 Tax=Rhagoletis pomonella TaxID=28610 RepID=UPI00177D91BE|nr:galactosylgalactosylxylosylprotein 3-beta-glucuronosyltransferase P-like isoform X1 [Rhagoletis pomonella]
MVSKRLSYTYTTLQHPFNNTNTTTTTVADARTRTIHVTLRDEKMAVARSIKMYLTIFVATTCIYMVLYQYHLSRQPEPQQYLKNKDISPEADAVAIARKYNSLLWSPMSLFSARQPQQQQQIQQQKLQTSGEQAQQSISEKQSNATTFTTTRRATEHNVVAAQADTAAALASPLSSPLQATKTTTLSYHTLNSSSSSASNSARSPPSLALSAAPSVVGPSITSKAAAAVAGASSHSLVGQQRHLITRNDIVVDISKRRAQLLTSNANGTTTTTTAKRPSAIARAQSIAAAAAAAAEGVAAANTSQAAMVYTSSSLRPVVGGTVVKGTNPLPPPLYIVTPTYKRAEQLAELTRLGYTLKHVQNLLWLVIEDANRTSPLVLQTLNRIGVPYEYFLAPMPEQYKTKKTKPRGVSNRNRGLDYIRANATSGVLYFADDDNTYDISIFEQMRYTKKVSMWPVGLVTKYGVSSPIIRDGKITGFYDGWIGGRKYPVDMAGFAVSVNFLHERPAAKMPFKPGYEEDGFLKSLAPLNLADIELLASNCTEILTWHTQTKKNANATALNVTLYGDTNLARLDKVLVRT